MAVVHCFLSASIRRSHLKIVFLFFPVTAIRSARATDAPSLGFAMLRDYSACCSRLMEDSSRASCARLARLAVNLASGAQSQGGEGFAAVASARDTSLALAIHVLVIRRSSGWCSVGNVGLTLGICLKEPQGMVYMGHSNSYSLPIAPANLYFAQTPALVFQELCLSSLHLRPLLIGVLGHVADHQFAGPAGRRAKGWPSRFSFA